MRLVDGANRVALHLRARSTFVDCTGTERTTGAEWLLRPEQCALHWLEAEEELVASVQPLVLSSANQYCIVCNSIDGTETIIDGPTHVFLAPHEHLVDGVVLERLLIDRAQCVRLMALCDNDQFHAKDGQCIELYGPLSIAVKQSGKIVGMWEAIVQMEWFNYCGLYLKRLQ
jgi:hypothetical protein